MIEVTALACTKCGSQLEIPLGIDRFACSHCGVQHSVNRGGGIISIEPIIDGLDNIREGTDRTASELAIKRLNKDKEELRRMIQFLESEWRRTARDIAAGAVAVTLGFLSVIGAIATDRSVVNMAPLLMLFALIAFGAGIYLLVTGWRDRNELQPQIDSQKRQYKQISVEIQHHKKIVGIQAGH